MMLHSLVDQTMVELDCNQIKILTENNQCYTMWERANILKISKSIKLLVKMKNVSFILWKKHNRLFGQPNMLIVQMRKLSPEKSCELSEVTLA